MFYLYSMDIDRIKLKIFIKNDLRENVRQK